jgi:hypothetical protein
MNAELPEGCPTHAFGSIGRLADSIPLVGGCGARGASQLQGSHGSRDEFWTGNGMQLFMEA